MKKIGERIGKIFNSEIIALILLFIVILSGAIIFLEWISNIDILRVYFPQYVAMKVNTSLCFILIGMAFALSNCYKFSTKCIKFITPKILARILACLVISIAGLTLIEHIFNVDFGIDKLFYFNKNPLADNIYPGRMAINTAINFILLGIAVLFLTFKKIRLGNKIVQLLVIFVVIISLAALMGYLTDERVFQAIIISRSVMAISSSILFLLLAFSVFLTHYGEGFFAAVMRKSPGGTVLRLSIPLYTLIILSVTILIVIGIKKQIYSPTFAIGFFGIIKIFLFTVIILFLSKKIDFVDLDPLTKLRNRNKLQNIFMHEISLAKRHKTNLCALFIDIDDFKKFNDTFGHKMGDQVLLKLADIIVDQLRVTDYAFRYGGEEFLILLPSTTLMDAEKIAQRIRNLFKTIDFSPSSEIHVTKTLSVGVVEYTTKYTWKNFIDAADKAMYQAKKLCKDRVCVLDEKLQ